MAEITPQIIGCTFFCSTPAASFFFLFEPGASCAANVHGVKIANVHSSIASQRHLLFNEPRPTPAIGPRLFGIEV